jgi:hypothetical protein
MLQVQWSMHLVNAFGQWWDELCGDFIGFGMNQ